MLNASPLQPNLILLSTSLPSHLNHSVFFLVLLRRWSIHGSISTLRRSQSLSTSLHPLRVDAWRRFRVVHAHAGLVSTFVVDVLDVEGVDMTREIAQERQTNINAEVYTTSSDECHAYGRH
jgi:hypothetical protein